MSSHVCSDEDKIKQNRECILHEGKTSLTSKRKGVDRCDGDGQKQMCKICGKTYRRFWFLQRHLRVHKESMLSKCTPSSRNKIMKKQPVGQQLPKDDGCGVDKRYKCEFCPYATVKSSHLLVHRRIHTGEKPYKCHLCDYSASQKNNVKAHLRAQHSQFSCSHCEFRCLGQRALITHLKIHTAFKGILCYVCFKNFNSWSERRAHMKRHGEKNPFKCEICAYATSNFRQLLIHIRSHTREKPYKCKECPYQAVTSGGISLHAQAHKCISAFKCQFCTFSSSRQQNISVHVAQVHSENEPLFCDRCPFTTIDHSDYNAHIILHSRHKSYDCPLCKHATPFKILHMQHMDQHFKILTKHFTYNGVKYKCKLCKHSYADASDCQVHLKLHLLNEKGADIDLHVHGKPKKKSKKITKQNSGHESWGKERKNIFIQPPNNISVCVTAPVIENSSNNVIVKSIRELSNEEVEAVMRQDRGRQDKPFVCQYCNRGFDENNEWQKHVQRHFMRWPISPVKAKGTLVWPTAKTLPDPTKQLRDYFIVRQLNDTQRILRIIMSSSDVDVCTVDSAEEPTEMMNQDDFTAVKIMTFSPVTAKIRDTENGASMRADEMKRTYSCMQCNWSTSNKSQMEKHQKNHTSGKLKEFVCDLCPYKSTMKGYFRRHLHTHQQSKLFKCSYCEFESPHKPVVVNHERVHTGEKPYTCKVCQYSCRQQGHLVAHMRTHTGDKPYKCKHCDYATAQSSHLKTHMKRHTGVRPYKCTYCNYTCSEKSTLVIHLRIHTGEKPFKCYLCNYCSGRKSHLQEHMKTHTGEKPYKCEVCDFSTVQHPHMIMHTRKHTREKPFKCPECPYRAMCTSALKVHCRMHTVKEAFMCRFCSFSSSRQAFVKNHVAQVHSVVEPMVCDRCPFETIDASDFKAHVSLHKDFKSYDCTLCNYSTPFQILISKHKSDHTKRASEYFDKTTMQYYCKMCRFSCTDALSLVSHVESHAKGMQMMMTSGDSNRSEILQQSPHAEDGNHFPSSAAEDSPTEATVCSFTEVQTFTDAAMIPVKCENVMNLTNEEVEEVLNQGSGTKHEKSFICQYCERGFDAKTEWQKHVQRHFMRWPKKK
ncbi:zinc finger protein 420-like [Ptychodera flava]|uniref:zinc finger protein 420-like n=1 Tax=Ptychodera flava TaxID=63121 RepID=UPI00396A0C85